MVEDGDDSGSGSGSEGGASARRNAASLLRLLGCATKRCRTLASKEGARDDKAAAAVAAAAAYGAFSDQELTMLLGAAQRLLAAPHAVSGTGHSFAASLERRRFVALVACLLFLCLLACSITAGPLGTSP